MLLSCLRLCVCSCVLGGKGEGGVYIFLHLSYILEGFLVLYRFVLSLENDLTVRAKTTEVTVSDFCSGSYATIFTEEVMLD